MISVRKNVAEFLKGRDEYTLHKPARKVFPTYQVHRMTRIRVIRLILIY
jgi:hypothetical protein